MSIDRRAFVAAAASLAASAAVNRVSALPVSVEQAVAGDDPLGVRQDFPILARRTFLNCAYMAPIPRPVLAEGIAFLQKKANEPLDLEDLLAKDDEVRAQFARFVNASPEEIGLIFSTSEGENILANGLDLVAGDNVVIDDLHYLAEFVLYRALEASKGIELRIVKHHGGAVDASDFEPHVDKRTRIVSVAWVSNLNGFRHDMRPIADLAHAHGALFHADAIQAVGMFPVDVRAAGVDTLSCGTYKWLLSGFGLAPFFVRRDVMDRIKLDRYGRMQIAKELPDHHFELVKTAARFDYSVRPYGIAHQLSAALTYLDKVGVARIEEHSVGLARRLYDGLGKQGHRLFTPPNNGSAVVTFYPSQPMADVDAKFKAANIVVTVRNGIVRIAPALFNTADEIDRCLDVTRRLV